MVNVRSICSTSTNIIKLLSVDLSFAFFLIFASVWNDKIIHSFQNETPRYRSKWSLFITKIVLLGINVHIIMFYEGIWNSQESIISYVIKNEIDIVMLFKDQVLYYERLKGYVMTELLNASKDSTTLCKISTF